MERIVDIIIPVYNGLEDLKKCISSIRENTNLEKNRLIIVDDCSTDEKVVPYLKTLGENIKVIYSERNKGFSGSVNIGMAQSSINDVILLNSDTIVTKSWVEKLERAAYHAAEVGTVTPMSNAATLASYPEFLKDNSIPEGYTIDSLAELVERVSLNAYPRITVAVGFCMYIKREVIDTIGIFDAETFQRGYGEENDFCNRAIQMGYTNILCDNTFIYHRGTGSFDTREKQELVKSHDKILRDKYPRLMHENDEYCLCDPNQYIRNNIDIYSRFYGESSRKKTILYILHADFLPDSDMPPGGTQLHVKDLADTLKDDYNIIVAARTRSYINITMYSNGETLSFKFYVGVTPDSYMFTSGEIRRVWQEIIKAFSVDIIHVNHISRLSLDIFYVGREFKVPVICTVHDGFMACPLIVFVNDKGKFCYAQHDNDVCDKCLAGKEKIAPGTEYIRIYRDRMYDALMQCDKILFPSEYIKNTYIDYYPNIKDMAIVMPHGIDLSKKNITDKDEHRNDRLRIAFLGGLAKHKGSGIARALILKYKEIDWFTFGFVEAEDFKDIDVKNYFPYGSYKREEVFDILHNNKIDIVCILSQWPETFCYTLSEALSAKIPVIATDIGALGDRIRDREYAWSVSLENSYDEVCSIIDSILSDRNVLENRIIRVKEYKAKTTEEMTDEYRRLYGSYDKLNMSPASADYNYIYSGYFDVKYKQNIERLGDINIYSETIRDMVLEYPRGELFIHEGREAFLLAQIEDLKMKLHKFKQAIKNPFYGFYLAVRFIKRKVKEKLSLMRQNAG